MMQFVTRDQWGAKPPKWRETISISKGMFIHYNGPDPLGATVVAGNMAAVCGHLRGVQDFHMGPRRGWPDIAYSWCVDAVGQIYQLRGWGVAGAHTLNWNWESHAVYLPLGGGQAPTAAQVAGVNRLIAEHDRRFGAGFVKGHQQAPNSTSCPGVPTMGLINAGAFFAADSPTPPPEPDGDDDVKPVMIRDDRTGAIWHVFGNTRYRLADQDEVDLLTYLGVQLIDRRGADNASSVTWLRSCKDLGRPAEK